MHTRLSVKFAAPLSISTKTKVAVFDGGCSEVVFKFGASPKV